MLQVIPAPKNFPQVSQSEMEHMFLALAPLKLNTMYKCSIKSLPLMCTIVFKYKEGDGDSPLIVTNYFNVL
jgi:hypothetical protein